MAAITSTNSYDMREKDHVEPGCNRKREAFLVFVMVILLAAVIGIVVWQTNKLEDADCNNSNPTSIPQIVFFPIHVGNLIIYQNFTLKLSNASDAKLTARLHVTENVNKVLEVLDDCSHDSNTNICIDWKGDRKLTVNYTRHHVEKLNSNLDCFEVEWSTRGCINEVLTDCVDVSSAHWYGGYADYVQQWPFEKNIKTMAAYVANDSYQGEIGGVLERYFFSSNGVGIFIDNDVPLYFSLNSPENGSMCFTAKYDKYPYFNDGTVYSNLKYKICQAADMKEVHTKMAAMFINRPDGIPDKKLFKYPIWSTWAQYHKDINQSTVLEFAEEILKYNFTHAQLEIDDDWTPAYGDMVFNTNKFPNASNMVKTLNDLGFRVTVWVHPFFNVDSKAFMEAAQHFFLIRQFEDQILALTPWWDGNLAGILDVTNDAAVKWFMDKLNNIRKVYNISSFKFDAGETSWMPHIYSAAIMPRNPSEIYPKLWVKLAAEADTTYHQEVRAGYRTQKYPVFVRMMDKMSNWGHNNALKTVIPCVLTYGILGYPFVLPDMIGGNAYNDHPDPELYIRWLQLNTFLPSMQFSIVPWIYNETVIDISRKFTKLHESIGETLIKYANMSVETGEPIIRPLWWQDPNDEVALKCEDEFLLGDEYLIAPIIEQGARSRDIYFPRGIWKDELRVNTSYINGPVWKRGYRVEIDELAYFKQIIN